MCNYDRGLLEVPGYHTNYSVGGLPTPEYAWIGEIPAPEQRTFIGQDFLGTLHTVKKFKQNLTKLIKPTVCFLYRCE